MNFSVACECSRLFWSLILGRLRVWEQIPRRLRQTFFLSCNLHKQDEPVPAASVCLLPWLWVCAQQDLATALGRDSLSQPHPWDLQPTALYSEQSWPRTCSGTPRAGEAEKPISAGW